MQAVVISLMILVMLSLTLKLGFYRQPSVWIMSALLMLFTGFSWPLAIGQSKSQIADWLSNPALMSDTAILLTIEVALQIAFCVLELGKGHTCLTKKSTRLIQKLLHWFPGILFIPVFFSLSVAAIFHWPGVSFPLIAWSLAVAEGLLLPLTVLGMKRLLPEKEARLELLFMLNLLIAGLGIVATVNGRTAVEATDNVEWKALLTILALLLSGGVAGLLLHFFRPFAKRRE